MTLNSSGNIVAVLKQKMVDNRKQVEKYKEEISEKENFFQVGCIDVGGGQVFTPQGEVERREVATTEACRLEEKVAVLEEELGRLKEVSREANERMAELFKSSEESVRQAKVLKHNTIAEDERQAKLEEEFGRISGREKEATRKYEEVSKMIEFIEKRIEEVENKAKGHEKEKTVLEEELRILTNNMKSLEVARDKSSKREEVLGERLKLLSSKSKETEARALTAEAAAEKLQDEVVKLQDDLRAIRQSNEKTEEEMESFFQDLRNL